MEKVVVNLAVIGSGPSGQNAAFQAAKLGQKVLLIERDEHPGGASLNSGTIPSKSLREAILDLTRYNERSFYGQSCVRAVTIHDLNDRLSTVLEAERMIVRRRFRRVGVRYCHGLARFASEKELLVTDESGDLIFSVEAEKILIATGSVPRNPLHVPFDEQVILDSTRLLTIDRVPKTMLVLGGGIIGTEYASFFAALGTKVTVIDKRERLLPQLDAEIGCHLQAGLAEIGLVLMPGSIPQKIERHGDAGVVTCQNGDSYEAEVVLYALGREANVASLDLGKARLAPNERGYLEVNEHFQTKHSHIYAAGDVIGYPALAATSMEQGRHAALHAFGAETVPFPKLFPLGIYTIPEISTCGRTEEELRSEGISYEVGRAYYYEIARSHITGSGHLGLFKLLFCKKTKEILGVHIVGRSATELIHIGLLAMTLNAPLDYFVNQVFNYPTFAEGYRIAALNGLNKL